jgi:putative isomerase
MPISISAARRLAPTRANGPSCDLTKYVALIKKSLVGDFRGMYQEPGPALAFPYLTPGSRAYAGMLWDWDAWLSNVALRQILRDVGRADESARAEPYERGCVLNFVSHGGWVPICISRDQPVVPPPPERMFLENMHKPVLSQHAAFLVKTQGGDAEWLRGHFEHIQAFVGAYRSHHRHACGLYYWQNDRCIGGDNDPATFYRPPRSSGSIFLNCMMYKELEATAYLCDRLGLSEIAPTFRKHAAELRAAVLEHCWDERDGFFYSVDLNLLPVDHTEWLHSGQPRHWDCLIQRIGVWSGFLPLWAGLATPEQAERVVVEHYSNAKTFNAPYGIRTLSRMEKMYDLRASSNPSSWLGPVWGVSNYLTFRGLVKYGFDKDAQDLAEKTIRLFGRDLERFGALHEYYQPENGEPIVNRGFQNWNYLVLNMIAWLEGRDVVEEF